MLKNAFIFFVCLIAILRIFSMEDGQHSAIDAQRIIAAFRQSFADNKPLYKKRLVDPSEQCDEEDDLLKYEQCEVIVENRQELRSQKYKLLLQVVNDHHNFFDGNINEFIHALSCLTASPSVHIRETNRSIDSKLLFASSHYDIALMRHALRQRANPNCYDIEGKTPLSYVLECPTATNRYHMVELLLAYGAQANLPDVTSVTPLYKAVAHCNRDQLEPKEQQYLFETVRSLVEHGARLKISLFCFLAQESNYRVTPLSTLSFHTAFITSLMEYLITYVYPEDIFLLQEPGDEKLTRDELEQKLVQKIIKQRSFLLAVSPAHPAVFNGTLDNPYCARILALLDERQCAHTLQEGITQNVRKLLKAPQAGKQPEAPC